MSETRNNHYVPQWHQEGFFEPDCNELAYLDLSPEQKVLNDGRVITFNDRFTFPTSRCFQQKDLYSTFFGTSVNDEIERRLFGNIDTKGSKAIRAFAANDANEWHGQFQTLFEYVDIQKIRTPKGLDWLKAQKLDGPSYRLAPSSAFIRSLNRIWWCANLLARSGSINLPSSSWIDANQ